MLAVLDYFAGQLAQRWPGGKQGHPAVPYGYTVSRPLLSSLSAPAIPDELLQGASARIVEENLVLAWLVRSYEPDALKEAIDRALGQAGEAPARWLSYMWPQVPGAMALKRRLARVRREGGRLPDGGGFREACRLFVLLNRFDVGPPRLEQFLQLCREVGVRPVHGALKQAARAGREFVTVAFLREAVARQGREAGRRQMRRLEKRHRPDPRGRGRWELDCKEPGHRGGTGALCGITTSKLSYVPTSPVIQRCVVSPWKVNFSRCQ